MVLTANQGRSSKKTAGGRSQSSKKVDDRALLIGALVSNLNFNSEDPAEMKTVSTLADLLNLKRSTLSYRIKSLIKADLVRLNEENTKLYRSYTMKRGTIYSPTQKGIKFLMKHRDKIDGHLVGAVELLAEGQPFFTLADLHSGNFYYKYSISSVPEVDSIEWDSVGVLNNDVERKMKRFGNQEHPDAHRCTVELFRGRDSTTLVMKPRVTEGPTPDDLLKQCDVMSWYVRRHFSLAGYEISLPKRYGDGKFTLVSPELVDEVNTQFGYTDRSNGYLEFHPDTGSLEGNTELAKALTKVGYIVELSMDQKKMRRDLIEEISALRDSLVSAKDRADTTEDMIADIMSELNGLKKVISVQNAVMSEVLKMVTQTHTERINANKGTSTQEKDDIDENFMFS